MDTTNNNWEQIRSSQSALHTLTVPEQTLLADNPINLKMLPKDSFGFSDHVMRFCMPVGENVEENTELTQKKSFLVVNLREDYFSLGSWAKHQEFEDDTAGQELRSKDK